MRGSGVVVHAAQQHAETYLNPGGSGGPHRDGVSVGAVTFTAMDFVGAATFAAIEIWSRCVTPLLPKKTC